MNKPKPDINPVGIVGLGLLGRGIATCLLANGFTVRAYNRTARRAGLRPATGASAPWEGSAVAERGPPSRRPSRRQEQIVGGRSHHRRVDEDAMPPLEQDEEVEVVEMLGRL